MSNVLYEVKEHIAIITLARPKALNALNMEMLAGLEDVFIKIKEDKNIYVAIVTGEGERSFVAGADISEMKDLDGKQGHKFGAYGSRIFRDIELSRVPVIAAINGFVLGGGLELALACDMRIAVEDAVFAFPEVGLGIIPGYGGTQRLPRTIGISKAKKMMYTAQKYNARQALEIGLIDEITTKSGLMDRTFEIALKIAAQAPIAVAYAKAAINKGINLEIDSAFALATDFFSKCFVTRDQKRAMEAFMKKEKFDGFENK